MKTLARILGSVLLLGVLAWHLDWGELGAAFRHLDWRLWALAAGVLVLAQCVSSWRWLLLARVLHFGGSLQRFVAYYFIGILFNLVLPTSVGGDVVRAWYLSSQEGSAPATGRRLEAFLTVFAERFSGVVVLLVLACVSTLFCPVSLPVYITGVIAVIGTGTVAGLFVLTWLCSLAAKGAEPAGTGRGVLGWILSRGAPPGGSPPAARGQPSLLGAPRRDPGLPGTVGSGAAGQRRDRAGWWRGRWACRFPGFTWAWRFRWSRWSRCCRSRLTAWGCARRAWCCCCSRWEWQSRRRLRSRCYGTGSPWLSV